MTNKDNPLNVVIVGCGIIGINHARALARLERFHIAAVVDVVPGTAAALADLIDQELGATRPAIARTVTAAAAASTLDLAAICTPSGMHVAQTEEALAAGLHVVLEKPLDVALDRGRRLVALADAAAHDDRVLSVISQHRFDPASVVVSDAVRDGRLGRITSAVASVAWWRSQEYYDSGLWRGTWELDGGGALMNQGVHTVDLLLWLLGTPVEVFAHTGLLAHENVEVEDVAVATVRFASGALAVLHATTAAFPGLSVRLQIHGSRGSAVIDDDQLGAFFADGSEQDLSRTAVPQGERVGDDKADDAFIVGHLRQYADIADAIDSGREPNVSARDALHALAVVRAVYVSATRGHAIVIDDLLAGEYDDVLVRTEGVAIRTGDATAIDDALVRTEGVSA